MVKTRRTASADETPSKKAKHEESNPVTGDNGDPENTQRCSQVLEEDLEGAILAILEKRKPGCTM